MENMNHGQLMTNIDYIKLSSDCWCIKVGLLNPMFSLKLSFPMEIALKHHYTLIETSLHTN